MRERERDAYSCGDHKKNGEQKEHSFESHFRKGSEKSYKTIGKVIALC